MADVEDRLRQLPSQVAGSGPALPEVRRRADRLRRRRRATTGVVVVCTVAAVFWVGASALAGWRSPVDLIIGPADPTDAAPAMPPADRLHNPGRLDVNVAGGRLQATLEITPNDVRAPEDIGMSPDAAPDATSDEGPWWILRNDPSSDVTIEYGFGMALERWTGDAWQALGPLPVGMSAASLEPGGQDRQNLPLAHIPDYGAFIDASASNDTDALFDAIVPLEPGWYRATKPVTIIGDDSVPGESFQLRATFQVIDDPAP